MKLIIVVIALPLLLAGCSTAGHGGRINKGGGLQATCAGGCAYYKSDGSGCEYFHENISPSCRKYFTHLCEAVPEQCVNDTSSQ